MANYIIERENSLITLSFKSIVRGDLSTLAQSLHEQFPEIDQPFALMLDFSRIPESYNFINFSDFDSMRQIYELGLRRGMDYILLVSPPAVALKDIFTLMLSGKNLDPDSVIASNNVTDALRFLKSKRKTRG